MVYQNQHAGQASLTAFLSLSGFTGETQQHCAQVNIVWAEKVQYF